MRPSNEPDVATMATMRPPGGFRSLPGGTAVLAARLRRRTLRRLTRRWTVPVRPEAILVSNAGRYVFRTRRPDGRAVVVKARSRSGALDREARVLRVAAGTSIVPTLVEDLPGRPQIMVTSEIPGEPLSTRVDDGAWTAAGVALRRLHATDPGDHVTTAVEGSHWGEEAGRQLRASTDDAVARGLVDATVRSVVDDAASVLEGMTAPRLVVVHGDCMAKHLLIDAECRARLVDFDAAGLGDPRFDLAVLTTFHPERFDAVLTGYGDKRTPELERVVGAYRVARLVAALHWHHVHGTSSHGCAGLLLSMTERPTAAG